MVDMIQIQRTKKLDIDTILKTEHLDYIHIWKTNPYPLNTINWQKILQISEVSFYTKMWLLNCDYVF